MAWDIWDSAKKGQELALAPQAANMAQLVGGVGILSHLNAMRAQEELKGALARGDTAALMRTPGGIDILGKLAQQQNAGITGALHSAQLQEIQRNAQVKAGEQQAKGALASLLSPMGSFGAANIGNPEAAQPSPNAQVFSNDADAMKAMQAAEASGTPFTGNVPNPANVRALTVAAGSAIPRGTSNSLLGNGQNGQMMAPRLVQDEDSPTKWSWMNPRDGTRTPGAPAPASARAAETAANAGAAGVGLMSPEALRLTAEQIVAGDMTAGQGYARSAPLKAALTNEVAKVAKEQGLSGKDLAAITAEFQGFKSGQRAVGTRQAQIEMAGTVTEKFVPLAIEASDKFDRTDIKTLNDVEKAVLSRTASPELRRFNFANNALINAYARSINPNGVGTVSDKDHAREILDTGFSKGDYKAAVEQLQQEIKAELEAPGTVKRNMRTFFTGKQPVPTASVTAPASGSLELNGYKFPNQQALDAYKKAAGL